MTGCVNMAAWRSRLAACRGRGRTCGILVTTAAWCCWTQVALAQTRLQPDNSASSGGGPPASGSSFWFIGVLLVLVIGGPVVLVRVRSIRARINALKTTSPAEAVLERAKLADFNKWAVTIFLWLSGVIVMKFFGLLGGFDHADTGGRSGMYAILAVGILLIVGGFVAYGVFGSMADRLKAGVETNRAVGEQGASVEAGKPCPECAETVKAAARKCRYCGYRFEDAPT